MNEFDHQRHKSPSALKKPRPLVLACPQLHSNVNFSRIVRVASCCGIQRLITCSTAKVDPTISRGGEDHLTLEIRRSLPPALEKLRAAGYTLVGLEQTTNSHNLHTYQFPHRTVLVTGHERRGLDEETLQLLDATVEIPVYGLPYSYNVATATAMALYEYCRQYPTG
jgi:tRNA G18 (ribose-2'-O)-methylase SpoU